MKICKDCGQEKELSEFHRNGKWFRNRCKKCHNTKFQPPTGKVNTGRFKKGVIPETAWQFGHKPWNTGKTMPPEIVEKTASKLRGRKMRPEVYVKQVEMLRRVADQRRTGKGRRSTASVQWSKAVIDRDGNKCIKCGATEKLHAHHIIYWKADESKRFDVDNGITYCQSCHMKHHALERKLLKQG